jgi:hypothetical protein
MATATTATATANYNTEAEVYLRNLIVFGDIQQAEALLRSPHGNIIIEQPLRTPTQLRLIRDQYGYMGINAQSTYDICLPLQKIDSLVVAEIKRRSRANWVILLLAARLIARRRNCRQRIVCFENYPTDQRHYTFTCLSRQRLIEQIFDRRILPLKPYIFDGIMNAELSDCPMGGGARRHILRGDMIPHHWGYIYIRFMPATAAQQKDPLANMFAQLGL